MHERALGLNLVETLTRRQSGETRRSPRRSHLSRAGDRRASGKSRAFEGREVTWRRIAFRSDLLLGCICAVPCAPPWRRCNGIPPSASAASGDASRTRASGVSWLMPCPPNICTASSVTGGEGDLRRDDLILADPRRGRLGITPDPIIHCAVRQSRRPSRSPIAMGDES